MRTLHVVGRSSRMPFPLQSTDRWVRLATFLWMALTLLVVATACADDSDDRQFASDPRTPVEEPTQAATPVSDAASVAPETLASPEALVDRRGAPAAIYVYADGALRSVDGEAVRLLVEGDLAAYAASPGGDQVAVVTTRDSTGSEVMYSITIYDADGETARTYDDVLRVEAGAATPVAVATPSSHRSDAASPAIDLSWAAQGGRLLLTHGAGHLIDVPLDGEPHEIETRSSISGAFQGDWSPRGDVIGLLLRNDEGPSELALVAPGDEPASVTVIAPAGGPSGSSATVESFVWKANGSGVFFLEAELTQAGLRGGTIVQWDHSSNSTSIVATGGQAGPAGSVTWFAVSPDGRAIMYRVALPDGDGLTFNGLYLRSLDTGQVYRVPVSVIADVTEAWWVAEGLVWSQLATSQAEGTMVEIVFIDAGGVQTQIASYALEAAASPVASPGGAATPIGTPAESPVASSSATPA